MTEIKIHTHPITGLSAYVTNDGRAFYTVNLLASLMGIDTRILTGSPWFEGVSRTTTEFSEILTQGGFQGVSRLIPAEAAFDVVFHYCTVARKDCTQAKNLLLSMGRAGATAYAFYLCGYTLTEAKQTETKPYIAPHVEAGQVAETIMGIYRGLALEDPRLAQILIDRAMQTVVPLGLLPGGNALAGCYEIAKGLGYSVGKECTLLGKACAKAWREAYGTEPKTSKRECGGAFRDIKVYPSNDSVITDTIREFYRSED